MSGFVANPIAYDTLSAAQTATIPATYNMVVLNGYYAAGDGGGARYTRTVSPPSYGTFTSADGAHWVIAETNRNLLMFGAKADNGVTDNSTYLTAAASFGAFSVTATPGLGQTVFGVNNSVSVGAAVTMDGTATFRPATGKTLTFNYTFSAPREVVFLNALSGQGTIVLNLAWNTVGYPEWWGAVTGSPSTDASGPINACIVACPITDLSTGAYYITGSINITTNGRVLRGVVPTQLCCGTANGAPGTGTVDANATQIVQTSPANLCIVVGALQSSEPSTLTNNVSVHDLTIARATATTPLGVTGAAAIQNPATGFSLFGASAPPCGLVACWCDLCHFTNVFTVEHSFGFYTYGCVESFWTHCRNLRYTAGQNSGNDFFAGFFQDNSAPSPYNSGNASIYFDECQTFSNVGAGGAPAYTYNAGFQAYDGFTDTYITGCETGLTQYGCDMAGRQYITPDYQSEDLFIIGGKFDTCSKAGIRVSVAGGDTAITILGNYCAINTTSASGIYIDQVHGSVRVAENQIISTPGNSGAGLNYNTSSGISSCGNIITDLEQPVLVGTCFNVVIEDQINCGLQAPTTAAILITGLTVGVIDAQVYCSNSSLTIPIGVGVDSTTTGLEVRVSKIDKTYITSGRKLMYNGSQISSAGSFGTNNLAQGIF